MKTKERRVSKRALAIIMGVLILVTAIGFGSFIVANAVVTAKTVYFCPSAVWTNYKTTDTIKICSKPDKNGGWNDNSLATENMLDESGTYNGNEVFSGNYYVDGSNFNYFYFQRFEGNTWKEQIKITASNGWGSDDYSGQIYDGSWHSSWSYDVYYDVNIGNSSHGSVSASLQTAREGTEVTLTPNPDSGYKLSSYTVTKAGGGTVTVTDSKFTMPGENVTVTATFTQLPITTIRIKKTISGFNKAFIWKENVGNLAAWSGETFSSSPWVSDPTYTNYYKRTFQEDWDKFQIILNNNGSNQTTNSAEYTTGNSYYIDSATAGSAAVLKLGEPETMYTVSVNGGSNGSVSTSSVSAGAHTPATLPTPTPNYGYKFKEWTKSSSSITITNPTSASNATVTASAAGTVTATYEKDDSLNLYIAGRFRVYDSTHTTPTTTYSSNADWNATSTNIPFTFDSSTGKYCVNTYSSLTEVSENLKNYTPYFFVYDSTNSKSFHPTSSTTLNTTTNSATLSDSASTSNNLHFNASSVSRPVKIWFDATTKQLSYTVPTFYTINVAAGTGGSISSSNSLSVSNEDFGKGTLPSATAAYGYEFAGWVASNNNIHITNASSASGATVTASAAGTVTATFSPVTPDLYIVGRFHYYNGSQWINTFSNGDSPWNAQSTNIRMTQTSDPDVFKLETNDSVSGLSQNLGNNNHAAAPYFFIWDKNNHGSYYASQTTNFTDSLTEKTLTLEEVDGNSVSAANNSRMRFNESSNNKKPVTIYFNVSTKKIWYETPRYYDITANSTTGGSYNVASDNLGSSGINVSTTNQTGQEKAGQTVHLRATPDQYHLFSGFTVTDTTNNQSVTVSVENQSSNLYSFTMPSGDISISASFAYKQYSYSASVDNNLVATSLITPVNKITGSLNASQYVELTAAQTASGGYQFESWEVTSGGSFGSYGSGTTTSTDATIKFYPSQNGATIVAHYVQVTKIKLKQEIFNNASANLVTATLSYRDIHNASKTLAEGEEAWAKVGTDITLNQSDRTYGYKVGHVNMSLGSTAQGDWDPTYTYSNISYNSSTLNFEPVMEEDYSTDWYLYVCNTRSTSATPTDVPVPNQEFGKRVCTSHIGFYEVYLNANTNYYFKVHDRNTWYDNGGDGTVSVVDETESTFNGTGNDNVLLRTTSAGVYEFKIDFTNASAPKVTVTFPSFDIYYQGDSNNNTNPTNGTYYYKQVKGKATKTVTFNIIPQTGYYVSGFTVKKHGTNTEITSGLHKNIASTLDSNDSIACTFTMVGEPVDVYATLSPITISVGVNAKAAGTVTSIMNSSSVALTGFTQNSSTGGGSVPSAVSAGLGIGDTYKVRVTTTSLAYSVEAASDITGTGVSCSATPTNSVTNVYEFTCTLTNSPVNATVNFRASQPTLAVKDSFHPRVSTNFTLQDLLTITTDEFTSISCTFNGTTYNGFTTSITAPSSKGTHTISVTAVNNRQSVISSGSYRSRTTTQSFIFTFTYAEANVNFYVDTHKVKLSTTRGIAIKLFAADGTTELTDNGGEYYEYDFEDFTQQDGVDDEGYLYERNAQGEVVSNAARIKSSIYSSQIRVPLLADAGANSIIKARVTITSSDNVPSVTFVDIDKDNLDLNTAKDVWTEVVANKELRKKGTPGTNTKDKITYSTGAVDNTSGVETKRIYVQMANDWSWTDLYMHYWTKGKDDTDTTSWNASPMMKKLGKNSTDTFFYLDIPKAADGMIIKNAAASPGTNRTQGNTTIGSNQTFFKMTSGPSATAQSTKLDRPFITDYFTSVQVNLTDKDYTATGGTDKRFSIAPTYEKGGVDIEYIVPQSSQNYVSVSNDGKITPLKDTFHDSDASIRANGVPVKIKVKGYFYSQCTTRYTNADAGDQDYHEVTTYVKILDPNLLDGAAVMSYETNETRIYINNLTDTGDPEWPASIERVMTKLSGTATGETYTSNAGIVSLENNGHTVVIKYAKKNDDEAYIDNSDVSHPYNNISIEARVFSLLTGESSDHHRYGFYDWYDDVGTLTTYGFKSYIADHQPTSNQAYKEKREAFIPLEGKNYIMYHDIYEYTDVVMQFNYYRYNPNDNGVYKYNFADIYDNIKRTGSTFADDADNGDDEDTGLTNRLHHTAESYTDTQEVRYAQSSNTRLNNTTSSSVLATYVAKKFRDISDDYYNYSYSTADIENKGFISGTNDTKLKVTIDLTETPKTYSVYVVNSEGTAISTIANNNALYQQKMEVNAQNVNSNYTEDTVIKWANWYNTDAILATIPNYSFRVTGDTKLYGTVFDSQNDTAYGDDPKSVISYTKNHKIEEQDVMVNNQQTTIENLFQEFLITDYFNTSMVKYQEMIPQQDEWGDPADPDPGEMVPYDDISFVGAGVVYYSVYANTDEPVKDHIITSGYVNEATHSLNKANVEAMIHAEILSNDGSIPSDLVEEDKDEWRYAQKIDSKVSVVMGESSGLVFKYTPYNTITTRQYNAGTGTSYTEIISRTPNTDIFRYSQMLGAFQRVNSIQLKNAVANSDKNLRVYSYYIYSYVDYSENEDGETKYFAAISDEYAEAPAYVDATPNQTP